MIREMLNSGATALEGGFGFMFGAIPETGPRNVGVISVGGEVRNFGPFHIQVPSRSGILPSAASVMQAGDIVTPMHSLQEGGLRPGRLENVGGRQGARSFTGGELETGKVQTPKGFGAWMMPGISVAASSYFMYSGFQENGLKGMYDAFVLDLAASTAVASQAYERSAVHIAGGQWDGARYVRARTNWLGSHMLTGLATGMGAYTGAGIGQALGGPIGAFAGAFAGAKMARSPLAALASAAIIGGSTAIIKGGGALLKAGYQRQLQNKMAHTSGSTAAFMTQGAVTMRGRAMQAIHKSHLNARSALGQEATFMHRPTNYFSTYRR